MTKLGRHTWYARHASSISVVGPIGKKSSLKFGIPVVWREPANHGTDCYFYGYYSNLTGINRKNRSSLKYPDLQSACRPVAHGDEIPVPVFGDLPDINDYDSSSVEENEEEVFLDDDAPDHFPKWN